MFFLPRESAGRREAAGLRGPTKLTAQRPSSECGSLGGILVVTAGSQVGKVYGTKLTAEGLAGKLEGLPLRKV